jgi:hypothetical protein
VKTGFVQAEGAMMRNKSVVLLTASCLALAACSSAADEAATPQVVERGTAITTAKLTRQDLTTSVSLSGKVTMNPVFGLVAPVDGQIRYVDVTPPERTPTKPTRVASVWAAGKPNHIEVPAGATLTGRLVDDRSTVTAGMPVVAAKSAGYGIVAEIDAEKAYQLADALTSVQVQIKHGPGPLPCTVLGTIAALPAGSVPAPPAPEQPEQPQDPNAQQPPAEPEQNQPEQPDQSGQSEQSGQPQSQSEATGMRLVCVPPPDTRMINGAAAAVEVVTASVQGALVAPVEAVAGSQGNGKVEVVGAGGEREIRDVVLGISDGEVVEIKSGLTGNETLAMPGPNLAEPPAGAPESGGAPK